ncbi:glycoside hydrolase family 16 protein, partial [Rhodotorula graminis WP1]
AAETSTAITGFSRAERCDKSSQCPESAPCCSEEGFCGTGRNCLAGCDPLASFQPQACAPVPACIDAEYQLKEVNRVVANSSTWNGDPIAYDWLVDKLGNPDLGAVTVDSETGTTSFTLSLTEQGKGTVITSTRSLLYGNVTAQIKSVAGAGILTSFALVSGSGDEIDFECVASISPRPRPRPAGADSAGQALNVSDRAADFHNYTLAWTPESITWLVDGVALRNVSKNSTADLLDPTSFSYPQTPSRIQFSIWAPGRDEQPEGLVDFAGGAVDWNATDYTEKGYY